MKTTCLRFCAALILCTVTDYVRAQNEFFHYLGKVNCQSVSINDTLRFVCDLIMHEDYIDYLSDDQSRQVVLNGSFIKRDFGYILWQGRYYVYNSSGTLIEATIFENGLPKDE